MDEHFDDIQLKLCYSDEPKKWTCRSHLHQEGSGRRTRPSPATRRQPRQRTLCTFAFLLSSFDLAEKRKRLSLGTLPEVIQTLKTNLPIPHSRLISLDLKTIPAKPQGYRHQRWPEFQLKWTSLLLLADLGNVLILILFNVQEHNACSIDLVNFGLSNILQLSSGVSPERRTLRTETICSNDGITIWSFSSAPRCSLTWAQLRLWSWRKRRSSRSTSSVCSASSTHTENWRDDKGSSEEHSSALAIFCWSSFSPIDIRFASLRWSPAAEHSPEVDLLDVRCRIGTSHTGNKHSRQGHFIPLQSLSRCNANDPTALSISEHCTLFREMFFRRSSLRELSMRKVRKTCVLWRVIVALACRSMSSVDGEETCWSNCIMVTLVFCLPRRQCSTAFSSAVRWTRWVA